MLASTRALRAIVLPVVLVLFAGLAAGNFVATAGFDRPLIFGDRTKAAFDLWSVQHLFGGILLGTLLARALPGGAGWLLFALLSLLAALSWEAAELAMESGWFGGAVSHWKDGFEHWSNRLLGDPLMVTGGSLIGRRFAHAWKIVLAPAAVWLVVNVVSPTSMSIQRLLF